LLAGVRPFQATDALELVHAHLARTPAPPHAVRADVPPALSAVVLKLLAKAAEDRYQSAQGLQADLEECLRQWTQTGTITPFPLPAHDYSAALRIPPKLYGREDQIATLLAAFERVRHGSAELLLVAGEAGVGKSALVHELHKPIARRG